MKYLLYSILIISSLAFLGCEKFDPAEQIPSFIQINSIVLDTDYATEGSNSSKGIIDAWVYVESELIGIFELPATIPILHEGEKIINIYAGIKRNGISGNRVKYPMFDKYSITTTLVPDSIINLNPVVKYNPNVTIFNEDFETGFLKLYDTSQSNVSLNNTSVSTEIYEGKFSGIGNFGSSGTLFEIETDEASFDGLKWNNSVYMELDYSTNHPITIGISYKKINQTNNTDLAYLTLVPTDSIKTSWNKVYIDLSEVTQPNSPFEDLNFFIGSQKTTETYEPKILIDNVKIVTY